MMYRPKKYQPRHPRGRQLCCSVSSMFIIGIFLIFNTLIWRLPLIQDSEVPSQPPHHEKESGESLHLNVDPNGPNKGEILEPSLPLPEVPLLDEAPQTSVEKVPQINDTVDKSSLLYVRYSGRTALYTLKELIQRAAYELGSTSTVCPPLPNDTVVPLNEAFQLGMVREFIGGMYHPVHCRRWARFRQMGHGRYGEKGEDFDVYYNDSSHINVDCEEEAKKAADEAIYRTPSYAYVMMVSNHRYLDGAMVLADSIREFSELVQNRRAEIVLIISEFIKEDIFPLLQVTFDRVKIFKGLQTLALKSAYKGTFDKIYLYLLEDYADGIFFMDADTLIYVNPDAAVQLPKNVESAMKSTDPMNQSPPRMGGRELIGKRVWKEITSGKTAPHLFAVGDDIYFQTGLLILRPSLKIFIDLYLEFRLGSFGYNQWRARDGLLFRHCFKSIGDLMGRPIGVHHFTGSPKPWFNQAKLDHSLEQMTIWMKTKIPQSWRDFKSTFHWWIRFESLHMESFRFIEQETRQLYGAEQDANLNFWRNKLKKKKGSKLSGNMHITKYGGAQLLRDATEKIPLPLGIHSLTEAAEVSPDEYMWMMRFTRNMEYLHPTRAQVAKLRIRDFPLASEKEIAQLMSSETVANTKQNSLIYPIAKRAKHDNIQANWSSCEDVCNSLHLRCDASALLDTRIADCEHSKPVGTMANGLIKCDRCLPHFKEGAPFLLDRQHNLVNDSLLRRADICFYNAWTRFARPVCNATFPQMKSYELQDDDILTPLCACV